MSTRHPYDPDDPFGSRPDEKPPAGWDARFWEGVRERIEVHRDEPAPLEPGAGARPSALTVVTLALFAAVAAASLFGGSPPRRGTSSIGPGSEADPVATIVRVDGTAEPPVAVEWARSGGCRSGYVVLQSLEPDISYVVLDQRAPGAQARR